MMMTEDDEEMAWRSYFDALVMGPPFTIKRGGIRHSRHPLPPRAIEGFKADKVWIDEVPHGEAS